jgi:outer membrane protein W
MHRRILIAVFFLAFPISLFAQNDVGLWLNSTKFKSTDLGSEIPGATGTLKFSQKLGYGVSFNHFSGPNMSTEFAAQQIRGKAKADVRSGTVSQSIDLGTIKHNIYSAVVQWHFIPHGFITPYVGGGAAYFNSGQLNTSANAAAGLPAETFKFKNKFTYVLNGGVNFAVAQSISVGLDGRYSPYKARDKSNSTDPGVTLNPFTLSAGVRFRM